MSSDFFDDVELVLQKYEKGNPPLFLCISMPIAGQHMVVVLECNNPVVVPDGIDRKAYIEAVMSGYGKAILEVLERQGLLEYPWEAFEQERNLSYLQEVWNNTQTDLILDLTCYRTELLEYETAKEKYGI